MLSKFLSSFRLSKGGSFDVIYENQWKNKPKREIFKVFRIATKIYVLMQICLNGLLGSLRAPVVAPVIRCGGSSGGPSLLFDGGESPWEA